ncbi:MAG TPA: hypothetical protein VLJ76_05600 [Gaiellaceae bacterium]|nr:hypothetical protein [Gaiellaceae bacterium]
MKRSACILVLAVVAAGCGGGSSGGGELSRSQYEAKMAALNREYKVPKSAVPSATDFARIPAYFRRVSTAGTKYLAGLRSLKPPHDVAKYHVQLIDGYTKEEVIFKKLADELQGAGVARIQLVLRRFDSSQLQSAAKEIQSAGSALAAKGYAFSST